ncbi:S8 family serine peptidase, partial [Streptomyces sp. S6]
MSASSTRHGVRRVVSATVLGLLLAGAAAAPAVGAETIRQRQWYLDRMQAESMWKTSTGKGVTVAVIDTGVDPTNPDLVGRVLPGKDYATGQPGDEHTTYDTFGHGTGMAALIAATGADLD